MTCATCNDYEFVEGPDGKLDYCPDCLRGLVECPVHHQKVMTRGGVIVGKCWGCVDEAAAAEKLLRRRKRKPVLA